MSIKSFGCCLLAATLSLSSYAAFPDKPVHLVVAYAPGGSTDIIARLLGVNLSAKWGQPVVVDNRAGASGMIGAEQVARAKPDGYTLLLGYTPEVSMNKLVFKEMRYDPLTDLTPIALVASAPLVLAAGPKIHVSSMKELLALKGRGQLISYGSPGTGGQQHIAGAMLAKETGLQLTHVPYRGTGLAVADLVGGQIDLFWATTPPLLQQIRAGNLKALAVAGEAREKLLPEVPTTTELGMPGLQLTNWFGVFGPKSMPRDLTQSLAKDVLSALAEPAMKSSLEAQGLTPTPLEGAALRKFIDAEMAKYQQIVKESGTTAAQ
jgi:tripartite-type tricarboxylate transporter receptor subunit TctC